MISPMKLLVLLLLLQFINAQTQDCVINGVTYLHGSHDFNRNCIDFTCIDGKWHSSKNYKKVLCSECLLSNDPHIKTFDEVGYDWHGNCTYVLAQEEDDDKKSFVLSKFSPCNNGRPTPTCIDTVYFKPKNMDDVITISKEVYASPVTAQVKIKEFSQTITVSGEDMQVLKGGLGDANREYPVLAYWNDDCLHIISVDTYDFMVKVCSWSIKIYKIKTRFNSGGGTVSGLCGSPDGIKTNDLMLRDGVTVVADPGGWYNRVNATFGDNWKDTDYECEDTSGSRRQEIENGICKASKGQMEEYINTCKQAVGNHSSLIENKRINFIAGCAFDRCIITQAGGEVDEIQEWLNQWPRMVEHEVFEEEHQVFYTEEELEDLVSLFEYYDYLDDKDQTTDNLDEKDQTTDNLDEKDQTTVIGNDDTTNTTTSAPELTCPIFKAIEVGNKQFAFFACPKTFNEARDFCELHGWTLASPAEHFYKFNKMMPGNGEYYLNVQPDKSPLTYRPMRWYWQIYFMRTETTKAQWKKYQYNRVKLESHKFCASLFQNDGLLACKCEHKWYFACESFNSFNVQRSVMEGDEDAKKLISPERKI